MAKNSTRGGAHEASDISAAPKSSARRNGHAPRRTTEGDRSPALGLQAIEKFEVAESVAAAQGAQAEAVREIVTSTPPHDVASLAHSLQAIMEGASPDDAAILREVLVQSSDAASDRRGANPDTELADDWLDGGYPYKNLLSRKSYEKQKYHLQVELLKAQAWVKAARKKVVILFEGRDAAGKGGTIRRFMEHLIFAVPVFAQGLKNRLGEVERAKSGISSDTFSICPRPVKSSCSTGRGTTAPAWSA